MGVNYKAVNFNRQKKIYTSVMLIAIFSYLFLFFLVSILIDPNYTSETLLLRATGSGAFLLLHLVLIIGPMCRLNSLFLPLLYNRRHLGVSMFFLALIHGIVSLLQFHGMSDINPLISLFISNTDYFSLTEFPFQLLGFFALIILFFMAATSHDFWMANLTAPIWKSLHMLVYIAYALIITHVCLGTLQSETDPLLAVLVGLGLCTVTSLHLLAAIKERNREKIEKLEELDYDPDDYVYVCAAQDIPENRARIIELSGERVAVFRYENKISAISNVCQHQNGPLGEGKIIDGCITCPWHGYQYRPKDGTSPPPFAEKVPTFKVKLKKNKVYVHPQPLVAGTYVEPAQVTTI